MKHEQIRTAITIAEAAHKTAEAAVQTLRAVKQAVTAANVTLDIDIDAQLQAAEDAEMQALFAVGDAKQDLGRALAADTKFGTESEFARVLHRDVIPMRSFHVAADIASYITFASEHGGLDVDDTEASNALNDLYPKQRAAVVEFVKANCPRNDETGFVMEAWAVGRIRREMRERRAAEAATA